MPAWVLGLLIDQEVPDDLPLLRRTEPATDDRQDERLLFFEVVVLGDAGQDDRAEQMALGAGNEHRPSDLLRQTALDILQSIGQALVRQFALSGSW